ncbi:MAG: sigma-54 interaction domain-containing protein [Gemmatimonadota bacterium]
MARIFIDARELEVAVPVREVLAADGHDPVMVETADEIEGRFAGLDEAALVLTRDPGDRVSAAMRAVFGSEIPRPPIVAFTDAADPDERRRLVEEFDLDEVLGVPPDPEEVRVVLEQQLDRFELQRETGIVGRTEALREVLERLHLIAPVNSTVLLEGESGTGKELVARAIHRLSPRRGKPFIAVNCVALPESLLESELFGHEKGAFTGATSLRRGMFELADGGTLLLDEIAEMPPATQTRLLRILESRRFMRVGGDHEIEVHVRVVAATNRDLRSAVERGEFRRDLYYRLNVLHISLPPLRERRADIPVLVRRFVSEFSRAHDREFKGISSEAMEILLDYTWPGNVRELRNLIESMVVLAPGSLIRAEDIPSEIRSGRGTRLLPMPAGPPSVPRKASDGEDGSPLPQLEFVFRTLVELKVDVEDLKQEFERYKRRHDRLAAGAAGDWGGTEIEVSEMAEAVLDEISVGDEGDLGGAPTGDAGPERTVIHFRPGMSMAELEREAIVATLRDVDGNRRRAAEKLQIGERTLYRKLKEYDIDL